MKRMTVVPPAAKPTVEKDEGALRVAEPPVELPELPKLRKRGRSYYRGKQAESRDRLKMFGVVQVGVFVPENRKELISAIARLLTARKMVEVCRTYQAQSAERIAVANKNFSSTPSIDELPNIRGLANKRFDKRLDECAEAVKQFEAAKKLLESEGLTEEETILQSSNAVAYSSLAAAIWDVINAEIKGAIDVREL